MATRGRSCNNKTSVKERCFTLDMVKDSELIQSINSLDRQKEDNLDKDELSEEDAMFHSFIQMYQNNQEKFVHSQRKLWCSSSYMDLIIDYYYLECDGQMNQIAFDTFTNFDKYDWLITLAYILLQCYCNNRLAVQMDCNYYEILGGFIHDFWNANVSMVDLIRAIGIGIKRSQKH